MIQEGPVEGVIFEQMLEWSEKVNQVYGWGKSVSGRGKGNAE